MHQDSTDFNDILSKTSMLSYIRFYTSKTSNNKRINVFIIENAIQADIVVRAATGMHEKHCFD